MRSRLRGSKRMSRALYHECNKPYWWARLGQPGPHALFLTIPVVRGDEVLDVEVDVAPGTVVWIGCGRGRRAVRETVQTEEINGESADQGAVSP